MDKYIRVHDYLVRHTHVGISGLRKIDQGIKDMTCKSMGDAKERLKRIYVPPKFSCKHENKKLESKYNLQIVIPMYNAQKYIISCIDSIIAQNTNYTYKIILVDDGSTDSATPLVLEKFKGHPLEVIKQANRGTAAARNVGISEIEADYVMFVDADDRLKSGAIELLLNKAYSENACIVEGGYELFSGVFPRSYTHQDAEVSEPCGTLWGFAWAKVMKAELWEDICFPNEYWYEDTIISYILYTKCKRTFTIKEPVYCYRRNQNGYSHIRGNDSKLLDSFWVLYYVVREMKERQVEITQAVYESMLRSMVTCGKRLMYMNDEIRKEVLSAFSTILAEEYAGMKSEDPMLAIFEKIARNNDYYKFRKALPYMKE